MLKAGKFVEVVKFRGEVIWVGLVASVFVSVDGGDAFVYGFVGVDVFGGGCPPSDFVTVMAKGGGDVFESLSGCVSFLKEEKVVVEFFSRKDIGFERANVDSSGMDSSG